MPLTTIDPKVALIIVDLQKGIVGFPTVDPIDGVIARNRVLAEAFRRHRLPVVLVNVVDGAPGRTETLSRMPGTLPDDFAEIIPELDRQAGDLLVTKRTWGAFASTDLDQRLKALDVTQVVVTGVATATGVEATARQAYEAGYHVTLALDAMTDTRADAQDYSIRHVFPRLSETGTTDDIIALLGRTR
ncbi:cysteine hydrolase [Stakelama sp. CBK3Z-3]|uniref:Cysteine hydrolase n=1 Tax=Stakelama flava TaxID=2860338 RepID=A0ABS6XQ71_9SPHN|nr:isochorismatase family cysteine hydrolase [Stakelama flava]MBW4332364.1 cysteine hydrolase [Stakelama flava]